MRQKRGWRSLLKSPDLNTGQLLLVEAVAVHVRLTTGVK